MRNPLKNIFIIVIFLMGCGPAYHKDAYKFAIDWTGWPSGPEIIWKQHTIICPNSIDVSDTASIATIGSNIAFYIDAWEQDFSQILPPMKFGVVDNGCECQGGASTQYAGCWRGPQVIVVTSGPLVPVFFSPGKPLDCYPVYHELCHQFLWTTTGDADANHSDARWVGWNDREMQLVMQVDSK